MTLAPKIPHVCVPLVARTWLLAIISYEDSMTNTCPIDNLELLDKPDTITSNQVDSTSSDINY